MNSSALFHRIFHPTDFSDASYVAFAHALRLAVANQAALTLMHTGATNNRDWQHFPRVRQALERWSMLPAHSTKEAIHQLGIKVEKVLSPLADPVNGTLQYLEKHPQDLIVLMTHQYDGWDRVWHKTTAETLARQVQALTLFVPQSTDGFVSLDSGAQSLHNILLPMDSLPSAQAAVYGATALAQMLGSQPVTFTLLHVGTEQSFPRIRQNEREGWRWVHKCVSGEVEQQILETARTCHADLIVMTTMGHQGFLDALRGSTTERIVRNASCPVLAVPAWAAQELPHASSLRAAVPKLANLVTT